MGTSYRLPTTTKPDYWTPVGYVVLFGGLVVVILILLFGLLAEIHDKWVFSHMTSEQHLREAQKLSPDLGDVDLALRHLSAIPPASREAVEAQILGTALRQKAAEMRAVQAQQAVVMAEKGKEANRVRAAEANRLRDARAGAISELGIQLKNLGYDVNVTANPDVPQEVIIRSSEFIDTDHRVRFLAFMRGRNSPAYGTCLNGFTMIRLRTSVIPFSGFDESYSLNC